MKNEIHIRCDCGSRNHCHSQPRAADERERPYPDGKHHDVWLLQKGNAVHAVDASYTIAQYKSHKTACNEAKTANVLKREFDRKIIAHSAGASKDGEIVRCAFASVEGDLRQIQWIHTDRGSEFRNETMSELLKTFEIGRSLSMKGCHYDSAVAEATYKIMKREFIGQTNFHSLRHLG